jgi:hypothetical protein
MSAVVAYAHQGKLNAMILLPGCYTDAAAFLKRPTTSRWRESRDGASHDTAEVAALERSFTVQILRW